jgi:uncharacterized protein YidB (DUF937 family)
MGLLDGLLGSLTGAQQQGDNPLVQIAMQMLSGQGQNGGLGGLIDAFQKAGLGQHMESCIGTGQNLPINADQLSQVLGSDKIKDIAGQLGMSHGEVSGGLADMLPQLIDKITPHGQVPADTSSLESMLGAFLKR